MTDTAIAIIRDVSHIKHRSQIVGGLVEKYQSQTEKQNEIARDEATVIRTFTA